VRKDCVWERLAVSFGGRGRQDQQQQQQQGLLQEDNEGNEWKDQVMLMSTVMVDKDKVAVPDTQKKRPDYPIKSKSGLFSSYVRKAEPCGETRLPY
jgi:hypothetical protein